MTTSLVAQSSSAIQALVPTYLCAIGAAMYISIGYQSTYMADSLPRTRRLFGITNFQVYFYYRNYKQDGTFQRLSVAYLWYDNTRLFII